MFSDVALITPAKDFFNVTRGPLPKGVKGVYIGTGGDLQVRAAGRVEHALFRNLPSGFILDIQAVEIGPDTTCRDLVAFA